VQLFVAAHHPPPPLVYRLVAEHLERAHRDLKVGQSFPFFLNFKATDRARGPEAHAARDSAMRILSNSPQHAVVFAYGDNDTYPVWYMQQVEGYRTDVTPVTIPLLGASWYRAELARRDSLLDADKVAHWRGYNATLGTICIRAHEKGRPVVAEIVRDRPAIPDECRE
jgi:hypothetical protein